VLFLKVEAQSEKKNGVSSCTLHFFFLHSLHSCVITKVSLALIKNPKAPYHGHSFFLPSLQSLCTFFREKINGKEWQYIGMLLVVSFVR